MLRQHVYYSITFIPGQFSPDIWTVDLENSVQQFDTVNVMNSGNWEVPENLWHRSTLFTALTFNIENYSLAEVTTTQSFAATIGNSDQITINNVLGKHGEFRILAIDKDSFEKSSFLSASILRTLILTGYQFDMTAPQFEGVGHINTASFNYDTKTTDMLSPSGSFNTIAPSDFDIDTDAIVVGIASDIMPEIHVNAQQNSSIIGNVSWNRPLFVSTSKGSTETTIVAGSIEVQETSSNIYEAN